MAKLAEPKLPRGLRNYNPGNIRRTGRPVWKGLCDTQRDKDFWQFRTAFWGLRALARILLTYQRRYGLDTIRGLIERYAPSYENETEAYIRMVVQKSGFSSDEPIVLTNPENLGNLTRIMAAIIGHENGYQPFSDADLTLAARSAFDD